MVLKWCARQPACFSIQCCTIWIIHAVYNKDHAVVTGLLPMDLSKVLEQILPLGALGYPAGQPQGAALQLTAVH